MAANDTDAGQVDVYERSGGTTNLVSIGNPAAPVPEAATGQRAAALKKCKKQYKKHHNKKKFKKCKKKANKLPV